MTRRLQVTLAAMTVFCTCASPAAHAAKPGLIVQDTASVQLAALPSVDLNAYSESDFLIPKVDLVGNMSRKIQEWQGVPYLWGGCTKSGTDCSGYVLGIYKELGLSLPHGSKYLATCTLGPIVTDKLQYGDVLIWPGHHAAIYTGNDTTAETINGHVGRYRLGNRNPPIVRRFLDALRNPENSIDTPAPASQSPEDDNMTQLIRTLDSGDMAELRSKIEADPSLVSLADSSGATLAHWAADRGNAACVKMLIEHGAKMNATKKNGVTPLHVAAALGRTEVVTALLASGVDPNSQDNMGRTPLSVARQRGNGDVVMALLGDKRTRDAAGASANSISPTEDRMDDPVAPISETKPAPRPAPAPSPRDLEARDLLNLVNTERQRDGLAPLAYDSTIEAVAQTKAEDVARYGYVNHRSPRYGTPGDMLERIGIANAKWAESIVSCTSLCMASQVLLKAKSQHQCFSSSESLHVAIGVARGGQWGRIYVLLLIES